MHFPEGFARGERLQDTCPHCGKQARWLEIGNGLSVCTQCGVGLSTGNYGTENFCQNEAVHPRVCYTRRKRFKKYLNRARMIQSGTTVPDETWEYLLDRAPYRTPYDIVRTLKGARHLKRKCYDSLPLLVRHMCPSCPVPRLSDKETAKCYKHFDVVDASFGNGPFISYLYVLEYILHKIGRHDLCPYLSRIKCRNRRSNYNVQLDAIFGSECVLPPFVSYM